MEEEIMEYVSGKEKPDFFNDPKERLQQIRESIRKAIATDSATLTVELDMDLAVRAEKHLASFGWTLEEACILYLYWCVSDPERTEKWIKEQRKPPRMID